MAEENITQEAGLKIINKTRNYLVGEINQNEMSKKHKKVRTALTYGCFSIFCFPSLVGNPIRITSSAAGIKIFAATAGTKQEKSVKKKEKKHDKIVMLAKTKLITIED